MGAVPPPTAAGPAGRWAMLRRHPWFEGRLRPAAAQPVAAVVEGKDTGGGAPTAPAEAPPLPVAADHPVPVSADSDGDGGTHD